MALDSQTSNSGMVNRPSLTVSLEDRYKQSKIKEVQAPTAVDFMENTYAKGFLMGRKQFQSDFTGEESRYKKGFSNQKYKG
jgi:hypothetical protein